MKNNCQENLINILRNVFTNLVAKLSYLIIIISPFLFLYFKSVNLFENNFFDVIYLLSIILLCLNSVTDSIIEVPGLKITCKNTGASLEVSSNLKDKSLKVQLHGATDERKVKAVFKDLVKEIK